MSKTEALTWGLAAIWGIVLGIFYFGGLWWTVRSLSRKNRPKLWVGLSYLVRTSLVLLGFWLVMRKDLLAFFFTLVAFFLMRFVMIRKLGLSEESRKNGH